MTVTGLEFTWQPAQPVSPERRSELLAQPRFGTTYCDHMVTIQWQPDRGWHDALVRPLESFSLHPATMAFHYGQTIFEGLRAFWRPDGQRALFRPDDHAARFNRSATRMAMPTLPEVDFVAALRALLRVDQAWVPSTRGHSLYLRPFMIASETHLSNRSAEQFLFTVLGTPSFSSGPKPLRLLASTEYVRAAPGGTGEIKCGGNYGGAYIAQRQALARGCDQVVWLDAHERRHIEESGGMNLFFVERTDAGPRIITSPLTGTLLAGVTRDSVLRLAERAGYQVSEERVALDEWEQGCRDGRFIEAFATGTAAVVQPVVEVLSDSREWTVGDGRPGPVMAQLRQELTDIQYGQAPDTFGWMQTVDTETRTT
ncbi:MAG TPA: branched-chain amino acid aminotransferase [Jatrophihabitans sp.]|jgi:branched-chain amino acid aminotransferase|uniref:branched-chain amino acid aminotransferase n=1 Tax=Jatrophihabitans sp. TaxID=1932789 RepID=UPI002F13F9D8